MSLNISDCDEALSFSERPVSDAVLRERNDSRNGIPIPDFDEVLALRDGSGSIELAVPTLLLVLKVLPSQRVDCVLELTLYDGGV